MRIDKLLSNLKYGTRNEIKKAIKSGLVEVNGIRLKEAKKQVDPNQDDIVFDGEKVFYKDSLVLMLNKPKGYVSANKDGLHKTVLDLVGEPYSRFDLNIAGRLDIDTEGLLILTNDGDLLHNLINPNKNVYKKYYVEVDQEFDASKLLKEMIILDGANNEYKPFPPKILQLSPTTFYLDIKEGKFHQVKRMCQYYDRRVTYLKRVAIGDIILDENLQLGEYKEI